MGADTLSHRPSLSSQFYIGKSSWKGFSEFCFLYNNDLTDGNNTATSSSFFILDVDINWELCLMSDFATVLMLTRVCVCQ